MSSSRPNAALKELVIQRAHNCCEYCLSLRAYSSAPFAVEHILPVVKLGQAVAENLCLSCQGCNGHKHTNTEGWDLVTERLHPLYNPRSDGWADHFTWNSDNTIVIGLTPIGRATVNRLCLNRDELINLRRVLAMNKVHPPDYPYQGNP